jgi:hypothetical protein
MFGRLIDDEDVLAKMRPWFTEGYKYPDISDCQQLIADEK